MNLTPFCQPPVNQQLTTCGNAITNPLQSTGLLVIQNAQPLFCTKTLDRSNYWAELDDIFHGAPRGITRVTIEGFGDIQSRGLQV